MQEKKNRNYLRERSTICMVGHYCKCDVHVRLAYQVTVEIPQYMSDNKYPCRPIYRANVSLLFERFIDT